MALTESEIDMGKHKKLTVKFYIIIRKGLIKEYDSDFNFWNYTLCYRLLVGGYQ